MNYEKISYHVRNVKMLIAEYHVVFQAQTSHSCKSRAKTNGIKNYGEKRFRYRKIMELHLLLVFEMHDNS